MKKKISLTMFLSSIWRGVCKGVNAFGHFVGYQGPQSIVRVSGRIMALCLAVLLLIFTTCLVGRFIDDVSDDLKYRYRMNKYWQMEDQLSPQIVYERNYHKQEGRIRNLATQQSLVEEVDWVALSGNGDSLAVFAKDGYRGFINRFTGEVVVSPTLYTHAWIFSEGLAAVVKEGRLLFIDHQGHIVIDNGMMADPWKESYLFRHGYCIVEDSQYAGYCGLMDKEGKWAVKPVYDAISYVNGLWCLSSEGKVRILSDKLETLFETDCLSSFTCDEKIFVVSDKHELCSFDPVTRQLTDMLISLVSKLSYETEEIQPMSTRRFDDEGHVTSEVFDGETYTVPTYADCYCYSSQAGWYGLMSKDGKVITPPMYDSIVAIGRGLYLCTGVSGMGVILNNKGEEVK